MIFLGDLIRLVAAVWLIVLSFTGGPDLLIVTLMVVVVGGLIWSATRWYNARDEYE